MRLIMNLLPLGAFYLAESAYGLRAGVIAAMVFTGFDLVYGWVTTHKFNRMALFSGALVGVLGGMSLLSDDERFVLWSPVIGDLIFAVVLLGGLSFKESLLEVAAAEAREDTDPLDDEERSILRGITWRFALNLIVHGVFTGWATTQSRETWLFVSGPLQYLLFGAQGLLEFAWIRWGLPPSDRL